jgi:hypothetical protein
MRHPLFQGNAANQRFDFLPPEAKRAVGENVMGETLATGQPGGGPQRPVKVAVDLLWVDKLAVHVAVAPFGDRSP